MTVGDRVVTGTGVEYLADLYGCDPDLLRSRERVSTIVTHLIREVGVRPIRDPLWQIFPVPGGITGLWLLAESHLAVHTGSRRSLTMGASRLGTSRRRVRPRRS